MLSASPPRRHAPALLLAALTVAACGGGSPMPDPPPPSVPPTFTSLSPTAGPAAGGDPVTLAGTGFSPPVTVRFGGVAGTILAQSATSVTVDTPQGTGTVDVTLTNSDGQASSLAGAYTFLAGTPPPAVGSITPASGSTLGGQVVTIAGQGFSTTPLPAVSFGGTAAAVTRATATLLTVTSPAHAAGAVAVTVTNPDTQADTRAAAFAYLDPPALTAVTPAVGSTAGSDVVTLEGAGFAVSPPPVVTFDGTPATVAPGGSATSLSVATPAHGQGTVAVSVTNPDGQASTLAAAFTFTAPAGTPPTLSSVVNDLTGLPSGAAAGGQTVTLTGTGFAPGAQVRFGAAAATGVTWRSTTSMTAVTPLSQPVGPVDVTVLLPGTGLAGTLRAGFTFLGPSPHVAALGVLGSPPAGGGLLILKGTGLQAATTVTFGAAPATVTSFTAGAAGALDELVVVIPPSPLVPAGTDGFVDVTVHNPDGQTDTLAPRHASDGTPWPANFHYGRPPVALSFDPGTGKGLDVTVTGLDFSADASGPRAGLQVLFSGPSFTVPVVRRCPNAADAACPVGAVSPSPTSLVAEIPSKQLNPGSYVFVVTNFDGQTTHTPGFFVVP